MVLGVVREPEGVRHAWSALLEGIATCLKHRF